MRIAVHRQKLALLSALLLSISAASPGAGGNFGSNFNNNPCDTSPSSTCVANNGTHAVYFGSSAAPYMGVHVQWAIDNIYNGHSGLSVFRTTNSSSTYYDVMLQEGYYGINEYNAWTHCMASATYGGTNPDRWCKRQAIKFNLARWDLEYTDQQARRFFACHELGHTLGLQHPPSGETNRKQTCMYPGSAEDIHNTVLRQHDYNELAAQY